MFDKIQTSQLNEMNRKELDSGKLLVTDHTSCMPQQEHIFIIINYN